MTTTITLLNYLRLMRLPNVFTALSNIAMGFFFTHTSASLVQTWPVLVLLMGASACLYVAGMILNDVFDIHIDQQERPFRPLPSGKISLARAKQLGWICLLSGVVLGTIAGYSAGENSQPRWLSGVLSLFLAMSIVGYNAYLKKTPLGPVNMGICRFLNVLLGMSVPAVIFTSATTLQFTTAQWLVAAGVGIYVVGITCFSRGEAGTSQRSLLLLGLLLMMFGIGILGALPWYHNLESRIIVLKPEIAALLFALLFASILRRAATAIGDPQPGNVQVTVKHALLSIIIFDAAITTLVAGPIAGLSIAALTIPAIILGRWVYST